MQGVLGVRGLKNNMNTRFLQSSSKAHDTRDSKKKTCFAASS